MITIAIDPAKLLVVTGDHGGYIEAKCVLCGAVGWRDVPKGSCNGIQHADDCQLHPDCWEAIGACSPGMIDYQQEYSELAENVKKLIHQLQTFTTKKDSIDALQKLVIRTEQLQELHTKIEIIQSLMQGNV